MKAQLSMEFMVFVSIAIVILTFSVYIYYVNISHANKSSIYLQASAICQQIKNSINNVITNGNGVIASFDLPNNLKGDNYTATVYGLERSIEISFDSQAIYCNIVTVNVTNSTDSTTFQLNFGTNTVQNSGGKVIIN